MGGRLQETGSMILNCFHSLQLHGQKFMRQVTYTRPPDWIDPFQDVESRSPPDTLRKPRILGPIIEEKSKELSATSNQVDSPLTYRSCGSTTSQTSRLSSRGKSTSARIKELRSSHLEQLNKHQDNHPRSAKRSASSQSLKSNGVFSAFLPCSDVA